MFIEFIQKQLMHSLADEQETIRYPPVKLL
jgi:hypothetical protein